jgi:hypothetical protein
MTIIEGVDFKKITLWNYIVESNEEETDRHGMMEMTGSKRRSRSKQREDRSQMVEESEIQNYLNKIRLARTGKPPSLKTEVINDS